MSADALLQTTLPLPKRSGKVRDVYDLGDSLLIVATDRISAYDVIMPNGIPGKGRILTALSLFWFKLLAGRVKNHLLATEVTEYPKHVRAFADQLEGRSMLVEKASVLPIECVARGYLAGSGWKEYQQSQTVCGVRLPPGLRQCDRLPQPIFTPATKEESGHDINISFEEAATRISEPAARELRFHTLDLYNFAADYARQRGIIIADTKFEFGVVGGSRLLLVDEVLTPDSSRFWPADVYEPGHDQPSFDKQYVRNWLETQPWDKSPPAPMLPPEVVQGTKRRYLDAYERLTGKTLDV
jgi:phosphoribosylaminoimidazole-succinocarboxamide synthase